MAIHRHAAVDDTVYFWFAANDTGGSAAAGTSPLADVRKAGDASTQAPSWSPTVTGPLSHASYGTGIYEIPVTVGAGSGCAAGDEYAVFATLTVDSENPLGFVGSVRVVASGDTLYDAAARIADISTGTSIITVGTTLNVASFTTPAKAELEVEAADALTAFDFSTKTVGTTSQIAGFTTAAKAELQAEAEDALVANNLDHLSSCYLGTWTVVSATESASPTRTTITVTEAIGAINALVGATLVWLTGNNVGSGPRGVFANLTIMGNKLIDAFPSCATLPVVGETFALFALSAGKVHQELTTADVPLLDADGRVRTRSWMLLPVHSQVAGVDQIVQFGLYVIPQGDWADLDVAFDTTPTVKVMRVRAGVVTQIGATITLTKTTQSAGPWGAHTSVTLAAANWQAGDTGYFLPDDVGISVNNEGLFYPFRQDEATDAKFFTFAVLPSTQDIADALKLAPTAGDPAAGSVNKDLDDILADTGTDGVVVGTHTSFSKAELQTEAADALAAHDFAAETVGTLVNLGATALTNVQTYVLEADWASYEAAAETNTKLGNALAAIRSAVAGRMALSGTTATFYEADGTTAILTYTVGTDYSTRSAPS